MNLAKIFHHKLLLVTIAAASLLLSACASYESRSAAVPMKISGNALVGMNGMTLYTFDKDIAGSGKSNCNGPCTGNWPPLYAAMGDAPARDYGIVMRDDGKKQWSHKGKPLYFWAKDQKPGDMSGEGFNNVWHVAKP